MGGPICGGNRLTARAFVLQRCVCECHRANGFEVLALNHRSHSVVRQPSGVRQESCACLSSCYCCWDKRTNANVLQEENEKAAREVRLHSPICALHVGILTFDNRKPRNAKLCWQEQLKQLSLRIGYETQHPKGRRIPSNKHHASHAAISLNVIRNVRASFATRCPILQGIWGPTFRFHAALSWSSRKPLTAIHCTSMPNSSSEACSE